MQRALLLIDIQMDYFPGGRMEVAGAVEASRAARTLLDHFREKQLPAFHVQHIAARPGAAFLLPGTDGIAFHESVKPLPGETVVVKHFPNSFRETGLEEKLAAHGVKELVVCGMMSHMCVDSTVRSAYDRGFACTVAQDIVGGPG